MKIAQRFETDSAGSVGDRGCDRRRRLNRAVIDRLEVFVRRKGPSAKAVTFSRYNSAVESSIGGPHIRTQSSSN